MIINVEPIVLRIDPRAESNQYKKQDKDKKKKKEESDEEKFDLFQENIPIKNKIHKITVSIDNVPHIVDIVI